MAVERRSGVASLSLLLATILLVVCSKPQPLRIGVTFEEAAGIEKGARVVYRDLEVGRVTDVGLDERGLVLVWVEIEDEYRSAVAKSSMVRIDATGLRRRRRLVVQDGPGERLPLQDGDVIRGSEGAADDMLSSLQEAAESMWEKTAEAAGSLADRLGEWTGSVDAEELRESLRDLGETVSERGREGMEQFREKELPRLRRQAEEVRRRLEGSGQAEEARRFWEEFERWLEEIETAPRSGDPPVPAEAR